MCYSSGLIKVVWVGGFLRLIVMGKNPYLPRLKKSGSKPAQKKQSVYMRRYYQSDIKNTLPKRRAMSYGGLLLLDIA
jgi:hypothetical protein